VRGPQADHVLDQAGQRGNPQAGPLAQRHRPQTRLLVNRRSILIDLLVYLAILVIVICLVWWLLTQLPIPEPARKFVNIAIVVVVAIVVIMLLLRLGGGGVDLPRLR
jgi:hypothetical protein